MSTRGSCRRCETDQFKRSPKISYKKSCHRPYCIIQKTSLMTVNEKYSVFCISVLKNKSLRYLNSREKLTFAMVTVKIIKFPVRKLSAPFYYIMIAVQHTQTIIVIKF